MRQSDISDCGVACLASVAAHYQLNLPVTRIRQYAGTDKQGTSVLGLIEAAVKIGFQAKAARGEFDKLKKIPLPALAHLITKQGLHHYVVIYRISKRHIVIMDPADGEMHKVTVETFTKQWTGIVVLILPGKDFMTGNYKVSNLKRFLQLLQPHRGAMVQALIGSLLYTILGLSTSIFIQKIVDFILIDGNLKLLNLLSVIMIILLIFQLALGSFKTIIGLRTGQLIDADLILGYYKHLLKLPQQFFDSMRVGEILSRVNDAVKIRLFVNDIALGILVNMMIVFFSIALLFVYYWKLALIMLTIVPIYIFIFYVNNRLNRNWNRIVMEKSAELETQLVESLNVASTVKRMGLEEYSNEKTESRFIPLLNAIYRSSMYNLYITNSLEFTTRLFTIIILWTGSYFVIYRELTPGELLSFYALIGYFTGPAASLVGANKNMQDALIAADRLFEIIDLETESLDEKKIELTPELVQDINFNNVSFWYGPRVVIFNKLNITIRKGKATAIVGESGSGKSTILSLLQNLYPLKEGNITIGDIDIQYISNRSLRNMIAVVPQEIELFSGTIIENIAIGSIDPDLRRILSLSKLLGINEFIEKLPAGYNTILREHGVNLSGGERQRLAIARALYRNPEILMLDEATSSLDSISEQKVEDALRWFKDHGKTVIIITHRLSTIKNCEHILVLHKGELVEQGTINDLFTANGFFKKMWETN